MQVTVQGKLFPEKDQARKLNELMRLQSSCMRYSYNRICEGKSKPEIEADLKENFSEINSRCRRGGYFRAKYNHESAKELSKADEFDSPEKVVFGGRKNLKKREQGEISNEEWKKLRNNQLYSRGDGSKHGNLNLRFVKQDGKLNLRVNVSNKEWIHVPTYLSREKERFLAGNKPYGVRIIRYDGKYKPRSHSERSKSRRWVLERVLLA
ncbi:hypothetical protein AKJ61_01655 [candidate division MSBL1 archaeon SCGC-AAA259B11]|uniref:Transposase putative helix-turn-helix domain-containing protein n=1 Tax=candidate division MSBL1 archaeon SCGC-AAA259B11 TaxID=1698260 RepID=A0A133U750_9EURY|nr:hypothetical protein AKJ61_01655 [candidate division MSBL1 archaeon SCGC-AAA259B11]